MNNTLLFRYTLSNPIEGAILIDEPVGWDTSKFNLKRDNEYNSILFEYTSSLKFYRSNSRYDGGGDFILFIEDKYGVDGQVNVLVEASNRGNPYEVVFNGRLNLEDLIETEKYVECMAEQDDFFTIFNQRSDLRVSFKDNTSVDGVALQPYAPYTLNMHSKVLVKRTEAEILQEIQLPPSPTHEFTISGRLPGPIEVIEYAERTSYIQFDFSTLKSEELKDYWSVQSAALETAPTEIYTAKEAGLHSFDFHLDFDVMVSAMNTATFDTHTTCGVGAGLFDNIKIDVFFVIKDADDVVKYTNSISWTNVSVCDVVDYDVTGTITDFALVDFNLEVDDKVYLYASVLMSGDYDRPEAFDAKVLYSVGYKMKEGSYLKIKGKTFTEDSTAPAMRIHDVLQNLCNKLTNRNDSFYSEFFGYPGAPYHTYLTKGCGADFVLQCGFNIRNFSWTDRPLQLDFKTVWESLNSIFCLSLSLEVIEGIQRIRIEPLSYAYTKDVVLTLDHVKGLKRTIAKDKYFTQIQVGYDEWKPEEINGLDEFATSHNYTTDNRTIGSSLILKSKVIASGSLIEVTRRNQFNATLTTDTKYDDSLFIIALNHSDPTYCEKNENYPDVNNLLSPETCYNLDLSPARNLLRNGNKINGSLLKKLGSAYKFQSGEGNYIMESRTTNPCPGSYNLDLLAENQSIYWAYADLLEVEPLWVAVFYEFNYPLSLDQLALLKLNKNKAVFISGDLFEEGFGVTAYIVDIEAEPVRGMAKWKCLAASMLPFNYVPEDAENLLLQDGNNLLLEDGSLILL